MSEPNPKIWWNRAVGERGTFTVSHSNFLNGATISSTDSAVSDSAKLSVGAPTVAASATEIDDISYPAGSVTLTEFEVLGGDPGDTVFADIEITLSDGRVDIETVGVRIVGKAGG